MSREESRRAPGARSYTRPVLMSLEGRALLAFVRHVRERENRPGSPVRLIGKLEGEGLGSREGIS